MRDLYVLSRFDPSGASSRVRLYAANEYFQDEGIAVHYVPLLHSPYLQRRYAGQWVSPFWVAGRMLHRWQCLRHVLRRGKPWLWVEYELFPWLPAILERWIYQRAHVILDFDDAVFHRYDQHPRNWIRHLLGGKMARLMQLTAGVTACNAYLEDFAHRHRAPRIVRYPSSVDLRQYVPRPKHPHGDTTVVGWLGSPSTSWYLLDLLEAIRELRNEPIRWLFVGTDPGIRPHFEGLPVEFSDWSLEQEVELLHRMDVGIMPLPDTPWTRGKCGYKLIQYMAVGLPVVASPVGINRELALPGETGFLARTTEEWVKYLRILCQNDELRQKLGSQGQHFVEQHFSLEKNARKLARTFRNWMENHARTTP